MRPRLLELPDAPLLASAAAIAVLLYTLWRAFLLSGDGWKKAAPTVIGGLLIAGLLVKVVAFGEGFEDAKVPIFSYGFMIMLGFAGVIGISALRGRLFGLDPNHVMDLGLFAMLGGIVGARAWHFIQYNDDYQDWTQFFQIWKGGIVFYGGLLGGFICCTIYIVKHKLNYWVVSEVVGPAIPIGIAFARIGCFLNGCCFGGTCKADSFAAVRFPAYPLSDPPQASPAFAHQRGLFEGDITKLNDQISGLTGPPGSAAPTEAVKAQIDVLSGKVDVVHDQLNVFSQTGFSEWVWPAQLFASFGTMLIFAILITYSRFWARKPGETFFMLLVLYAPFRFWMEMFRADTPIITGGMTAGQLAGIPLILLGVAGVAWVRFGNPPHMAGMRMIDGVVSASPETRVDMEQTEPDAAKTDPTA